MKLAARFFQAGFHVYSPLWLHFAQGQSPVPFKYTDCIDHCLAFLSHCDALIRIPGNSKGADIEVEYAKQNDIPVMTIREFLRCQDNETYHKFNVFGF